MTLLWKLRRLESHKHYISNKEGLPYPDLSQDPQNAEKIPLRPKMKNLEITYSGTKEWSNIGANGDIGTELITYYLSSHVNLENCKLKMIR